MVFMSKEVLYIVVGQVCYICVRGGHFWLHLLPLFFCLSSSYLHFFLMWLVPSNCTWVGQVCYTSERRVHFGILLLLLLLF